MKSSLKKLFKDVSIPAIPKNSECKWNWKVVHWHSKDFFEQIQNIASKNPSTNIKILDWPNALYIYDKYRQEIINNDLRYDLQNGLC